jgi:hypothetical protein
LADASECTSDEYWNVTACVVCSDSMLATADHSACACNTLNYVFDPDTNNCSCSRAGYLNTTSGICILCENGAVPNNDGTACNCTIGYDQIMKRCCNEETEFILNGRCISCPLGAILDQVDSTCECQGNATYSTTEYACICNQSTEYYYNGTCIECLLTSTTTGQATIQGDTCACAYSTYIYNTTEENCVCPKDMYSYNDVCYGCPYNSTFVPNVIASNSCVCDPS